MKFIVTDTVSRFTLTLYCTYCTSLHKSKKFYHRENPVLPPSELNIGGFRNLLPPLLLSPRNSVGGDIVTRPYRG